jgi:hypothetical protein
MRRNMINYGLVSDTLGTVPSGAWIKYPAAKTSVSLAGKRAVAQGRPSEVPAFPKQPSVSAESNAIVLSQPDTEKVKPQANNL